MTERILIDAAHPEEMRVALVHNQRLEEFEVESAARKPIKSNIYLGKITRVEPSLQAAFVEYGGNRQGFLPFSEIHYDYYQIPVADKERIAEALARAAEDSSRTKEAAAPQIAAGHEDTAAPESAPWYPPEEQYGSIAGMAGNDMTAATADSVQVQSADTGAVPAEEAEDLGGDDEMQQTLRARRSELFRQYKIQEVIKRNQIVLLQVIKEERGTKGASLTTYVSLAGRYCVLMPNTDKAGGVSRRINDPETRRRLRNALTELEPPKGMSVILRTAGMDRSKEEIKRDFDYLLSQWNNIRERTLRSQAPALIYEEGTLIRRALRDMYRPHLSEILIEGAGAFASASEFMQVMDPDHIGKIKEYKDATPIFKHYRIETQLDELYNRSVRLHSGGSLVISPTEAMVSIDVNSGRSTRERNIEDTALKTNIEAAAEIARQIRLRDLSGLVVIDFIDMRELRNRRAVERALKEALKSDRAKIQVGRISMFGLLEMSRQRLRSSIVETSTVACQHCNGTGVVRADESISLMLLRALESEAAREGIEEVCLTAAPGAAIYLLNRKRREIAEIEKRSGVRITVRYDAELAGAGFRLDKQRIRRRDRQDSEDDARRAKADESAAEPRNDNTPGERDDEIRQERGFNDREYRRGRRGGRGGRRRGYGEDTPRSHAATDLPLAGDIANEAATPSAAIHKEVRDVAAGGASEENPRPRRGRRGAANGRRRRTTAGETADSGIATTEELQTVALSPVTESSAGGEEKASRLRGLWKKITT